MLLVTPHRIKLRNLVDVKSLYGFKNKWSRHCWRLDNLAEWHGNSLNLDGTNSRCFLAFLLPGSSTRYYAHSNTSWKWWVWWSMVVCNIAERQHPDNDPLHPVRAADKTCCICGCDSSRKLMTPKSATASVVTVIVTTWNRVGWILSIPILINHHLSNPGGGSLHPNNPSNTTLWSHHYCTK